MGIKELWTVLTPYSERKPISELRGKTLAIDLAGWVCESLNAVDYFVHPCQHLKNLFFRTCYLIWEEVTPVFVLEGTAPKLKSQIIAKRNELQFRGNRPRQKDAIDSQAQAVASAQTTNDKGRTRFNYVLKQCENLLEAMGMQCVQAPGEAEAYCAFLNKKGLVDGVISQDSDCFAYGALRVYRNFSISTQGAQAAQGGAVDIYDMRQICDKMDFGQNKIIVMALLCGCDYCPDGIGGIGRDGVLKLFNRYTELEILERVRSWREDNAKYSALEMRVDDKSVCSNCGHMGRTQSHTKSGCGVCRTNRGCDESLWKEERLSLKAELCLRKKAIADPTFPCEEIVEEFLREPKTMPQLQSQWKQPNIVKFVRQIGQKLQWPEIYCFQKFLPVLTRWQVRNASKTGMQPKQFVKKRTQKGIPSLEIVWQDERDCYKRLIPADQLREFEIEHNDSLTALWTTVEPYKWVEEAYPDMLAAFLKSKEKPKKTKQPKKTKAKSQIPLGSLENLMDLQAATNDIAKQLKKPPRRKALPQRKGLQMIDKYFKPQQGMHTPIKRVHQPALTQCSTPITTIPSDLDSDCDGMDMSDIVNGIIANAPKPVITRHAGHLLRYETLPQNFSLLLDDLDVIAEKRNLSVSMTRERYTKCSRVSLDDSFDVLVHKHRPQLLHLLNSSYAKQNESKAHVTHFEQQQQQRLSSSTHESELAHANVSYFFNNALEYGTDAFEQHMDQSCGGEGGNDLILISDSDDNDDDESNDYNNKFPLQS